MSMPFSTLHHISLPCSHQLRSWKFFRTFSAWLQWMVFTRAVCKQTRRERRSLHLLTSRLSCPFSTRVRVGGTQFLSLARGNSLRIPSELQRRPALLDCMLYRCYPVCFSKNSALPPEFSQLFHGRSRSYAKSEIGKVFHSCEEDPAKSSRHQSRSPATKRKISGPSAYKFYDF